MDAAATALKRMQLNFTMEFLSDIDPKCQKVLEFVHKPALMFHDITNVDPDTKGYVDVYVWTPPCQDFSMAGKRAGAAGPRQTGKLMAKSLGYIRAKKPRLAIFENVFSLTYVRFRIIMMCIVKHLKESGYVVHHKIVNSNTCGLPQDRRRLFITAIRKDSIKQAFVWPKVCKAPSLNSILDQRLPTDVAGRLPAIQSQKVRCLKAFKECHQNGIDPRVTPIAVDIDCGMKFFTYGIDECKTLTRNRGGSGGPWISTRGRRTTTQEILKAAWALMKHTSPDCCASGLPDNTHQGCVPFRLTPMGNVSGLCASSAPQMQGFTKADVPFERLGITARQIGMMAGNAVSVNTMGCVLAEGLWSAGLVMEKPEFPITSHT